MTSWVIEEPFERSGWWISGDGHGGVLISDEDGNEAPQSVYYELGYRSPPVRICGPYRWQGPAAAAAIIGLVFTLVTVSAYDRRMTYEEAASEAADTEDDRPESNEPMSRV